jgi:CubicO group peptidase (beta-lactamase class C family)
MNTDMPNRRHLAALLLALLPLGLAPAQNPPAKSLAAVLQPFVDKHELAGAVTLVANKEKVLDLGAVGFADIMADRNMTPDDLFWIASQSKPITATALMMLVDDGLVKLDDPVQKYLPEFNNVWVRLETKDKTLALLKRPQHPITIREILSHTSGLPFSSLAEQPTLDLLTLRVGALSYAMTPLLCEPGTEFHYSNAGINTAGRIIEVVSGMSYEDFLQKRLFDPLGMKDTTFWPSEMQLKRLAKSYRPNKAKDGLEEFKTGQLKYPLSDHSRQPMPAGGLFSTATDVARFCQMVLNGGTFGGKHYLSENAVKEMTNRQSPPTMKESYGLGWSVSGNGFGHGGAHSTNMNIDTKRGLVTVFMVQHGGFPGNGGESAGVFRKAAEDLYGPKN